jgi:class 3 adenylate cyclase
MELFLCPLNYRLTSYHLASLHRETHDNVTVFFSDIIRFTDISRALSPVKVCNMLDRLYLAFDQLANQHEVFKVETIGDAWMGVTNCK